MEKAPDDFFEAIADCGPGTRYRFRIGQLEFPDIASRQQDGDTRGWSIVREQLQTPVAFSRPWHEMVVCEVHVGTATPEGTFVALRNKLERFGLETYSNHARPFSFSQRRTALLVLPRHEITESQGDSSLKAEGYDPWRDPVFEEDVRNTAYFLWEQDGRPQGSEQEYWYRALEQCLRRRNADFDLREEPAADQY
jgi:hypothetical protein